MDTVRTKRSRHPHDDAPDTAETLRRMAALPEGPEKAGLQQEVAAAWLPMAQRLARKFRNRGIAVEDLEQVAALGLVKAVGRYDPSLGHAFESFAVPTITGELKRHFRDNSWDVHVPRRVQELRNKVRAGIRELSAGSDDRAPTVAEIAERTGLGEDDVQLGMEALRSYSSLSLEAEMAGQEDGCTLLDTLGSEEPGYEQVVDRESVKPCLCHLPERERLILYLRFFCEMTQSRIADQLGISQMHVSRLISRSCRRIREEVEAAEREGPRRHGGPAEPPADEPAAA
ncbi:SigB/SigF/SigG family RNA polymerase sigma factor [Streptomyces sp. ODS28]|uniref:SigB/SigF/SigG family RNA polymerase sigma factor n=1 Tax=Streptomyces sp. ODS28 TaxID=3136688 RepID=UPI0031ECC677